jgi:hypothetical protein
MKDKGMTEMLDEYSDYYADLLDNTYDCVDRIVLNAYFSMGQGAGGFRTWWRQLMGSDEGLDDAHLMRMAGRFSRRVRAHAKAHQISLKDCEPGERKHEMAEEYLPKDANFTGVFLILVARAPAPVWDVQCSKSGKIVNLAKKYPYVNHYSFHILDPEWGHVTIKMSGHPPFGAQIMLNGHEYVACQAKKEGLQFTKEDNCFTQISNPTRLAQLADTLSSPDIIGRLRQVCERWIYSACLCFALDLDEQEKSNFHYDYSIYQEEYSRNLLFRRGSELEQVFQGTIDRTRSLLEVKTLKTIFGTKQRPSRCKHQKEPRCEVVVERPAYDLTIFKIHFGKITAKMYSKGARVLRTEVIVHNTKELHCGRLLPKFSEIVLRLKEILNRFLNALRCIDIAAISENRLDDWYKPSQVGQTRVGGVNLNQPRMRSVLQAVMALSAAPHGFQCADLAAKVQEHTASPYTPRQAAYDLKKLRGKNLVRKIENSRRYEPVPEGLREMTALFVLREKVIKPVLAGAGKTKRGSKPKYQSQVDLHYANIQTEMHNLFQTLGLAV